VPVNNARLSRDKGKSPFVRADRMWANLMKQLSERSLERERARNRWILFRRLRDNYLVSSDVELISRPHFSASDGAFHQDAQHLPLPASVS